MSDQGVEAKYGDRELNDVAEADLSFAHLKQHRTGLASQ